MIERANPAGKAAMTISEFCEQRFLRYHAVSPGTRQEYGYLAKNHIVPYVGHLRISEVSRETFFNLLVNVLPAEEASQITMCVAVQEHIEEYGLGRMTSSSRSGVRVRAVQSGSCV